MSAIPVFAIHCDAGGCRTQYNAPLPYLAFTATEIRGRAVEAGWTRKRRNGRLVDLCPSCSERGAR